MSLCGVRRKRILEGDIDAGDAFGVRVFGLADHRYGMSFCQKPKPDALFGSPADL